MQIDPIYGATWIFLYCPMDQIIGAAQRLRGLSNQQRKGLTQHLENGFRDAPAHLAGRTIWNGGGSVDWVVIWVNPVGACVQATLAHECFHGVVTILHSRGLSLVDASDEAYAYYLSWAVSGWEEGVK